MHAHIYTHILSCLLACLLTDLRTSKQETKSKTCTHTDVHARIHTYIHTYVTFMHPVATNGVLTFGHPPSPPPPPPPLELPCGMAVWIHPPAPMEGLGLELRSLVPLTLPARNRILSAHALQLQALVSGGIPLGGGGGQNAQCTTTNTHRRAYILVL